ncbi:hypothetical protein H8709_11185 [Oscillospiraceae bacterium NSJ-54]|uniref:Uncharacterized protein n=1 Tax=Zongyangia hominis TaxID=2763677 RepID=A0A926ICR1_9FIRM|nr:hypothetical protein [Zongyangia hominis]
MEQIEMMTQFLGKVFFQKDLVPEEFYLVDANSLSEGDLTAITVKRLLSQRRLNEAENLIFEEVEKDPSPRMLKIACDFYAALMELDEGALEAAQFGADEIIEGIRDIQRIYGIKDLGVSG